MTVHHGRPVLESLPSFFLKEGFGFSFTISLLAPPLLSSYFSASSFTPLLRLLLIFLLSLLLFPSPMVVLVIKNLPANAGDLRDAGVTPGSRRSPGGGHGNPLQYSCLENSTDRGAWWATVHKVTKSWTLLSD